MQVHNLPEILKPRDVAELFRVDTKTVARWTNSGRLPSFRTVGRHRRFYKKDVERLLDLVPVVDTNP